MQQVGREHGRARGQSRRGGVLPRLLAKRHVESRDVRYLAAQTGAEFIRAALVGTAA